MLLLSLLINSQSSKQYNIKVLLIDSVLIQRLALVQIDNRAIVKYNLDRFQVHLAKDGMVVVQAQVRHVDLHVVLATHSKLLVVVVLLPNLKEAFLDLSLYLRP